MSYVLFVVGFLGFFITNIYLIVQAIKKKFRKKLLLPPLICFILCIVGVMPVSYTHLSPDAFQDAAE